MRQGNYHRILTFLPILFVILAIFIMPAQAATYYVSPGGNDGSVGTLAQPFRTLNKGINMLRAGDTLYLRGGTYTPGAIGQHGTGTIASGTSWQNAITIAAYPGETATLAGYRAGISLTSGESYLIFDRINIDIRGYGSSGGIFMCCGTHHIRYQNGEVQDNQSGGNDTGMLVSGSGSHVEFLNSKFHGGTWYAFYWYGDNGLIDGNEVYDNKSYGMHLYYRDGGFHNNIIRNNRIYNNGFHDPRGYGGCGLLVASGGNNVAYNNLVYNNACGIQVDYTQGQRNNQVYNNTITNNRDSGISVGQSAVGTVVRNNILYRNGTGDNTNLINWGDTALVVSHNLMADPRFANGGAGDFRLQSGSPAIDAGISIAVVTTDIAQVPRPQGAGYDIGAYEQGGAPRQLPPPRNLRVVGVAP